MCTCSYLQAPCTTRIAFHCSYLLPTLSVSSKSRQACLAAPLLGQISNILQDFQNTRISVSSTECWNHDYTSDHTSINVRTQKNFKINQNDVSAIHVSILLRQYRISFLKLQIRASFRDQISPALSPTPFCNFAIRAVEQSHVSTSKRRPVQGNAFPASYMTGAARGPPSESPRTAQSSKTAQRTPADIRLYQHFWRDLPVSVNLQLSSCSGVNASQINLPLYSIKQTYFFHTLKPILRWNEYS